MATKLKLLDAAEALFADYGFKDTSLRQITIRAGTNVAAVNYHFGDKKRLIQAVLDRYLQVFAAEVQPRLDQLQQQATVEGPDLVALLFDGLRRVEAERPDGVRLLMRLLGHAYGHQQGHLRQFLHQEYGATLQQVLGLFLRALPGLSQEQLFWRLHFALGALIFSLGNRPALDAIAQAEGQPPLAFPVLIQQLAAFFLAGLIQPLPAEAGQPQPHP